MDKNVRVAIIGGGPAGLSAGMYLEKKGYENYVIYEKSDRVGGNHGCTVLLCCARCGRVLRNHA